MNRREAVKFIFAIAKEIEHSFESPVILFTLKDYSDAIFHILLHMHQALLDHAPPGKVLEIISSFHMQWVEAVNEIEKFRKRIKETPRDVVLKAIDFTIECTRDRFMNLQKYIKKMVSDMTKHEHQLMQTDLDNIKEMREIVKSALREKQNYIRSQADQAEYHIKIQDEIDELLNWLDRLNDSLAIQFCKVVELNIPIAPSDLTKTLKQVIDGMAADPTPEAQKIAELIQIKGDMISNAIRISSVNELEISKVIEKIKTLEDRINRLHSQNSSALMALKHKTIYLEERLQSLENIKKAMTILKTDTARASARDNFNSHIFNHLLPHCDRSRLVEQLIRLWRSAIMEHDNESIISILSVTDFTEIYTDDKGNFTVDKYGRKIYTNPNNNIIYQLNENNDLVPVRDDDKCVYFYDACGRYYLNEAKERIYKDHDGASEYVLNQTGYLVKVFEEINGIPYFYDWLGRYYVNEHGTNIYCEENSVIEYEHDGLGNLVKVRTESLCYDPCPKEPITLEENKYLKRVLGPALKKCIAEVVLHEPNDPIAYLAALLVKYSDNIKAHEKLQKDEKERLEERELLLLAEQTIKENSPVISYTENESNNDYNFTEYKHEIEDDFGILNV